MCCTWDLNLRSLKMNMYYRKREWHYKNISPLILAEHYVDLYRDANTHATITTCRVHCFEGQPKYVEVDVQTYPQNNDARKSPFQLYKGIVKYDIIEFNYL